MKINCFMKVSIGKCRVEADRASMLSRVKELCLEYNHVDCSKAETVTGAISIYHCTPQQHTPAITVTLGTGMYVFGADACSERFVRCTPASMATLFISTLQLKLRQTITMNATLVRSTNGMLVYCTFLLGSTVAPSACATRLSTLQTLCMTGNLTLKPTFPFTYFPNTHIYNAIHKDSMFTPILLRSHTCLLCIF